MTNNTSKYSATLEALKSIKHINNLIMHFNNDDISIIDGITLKHLIEARENILVILYIYDYNKKIYKALKNVPSWEEEQRKIDFYISLYELAEKGRVAMFTEKEGE